MTEKNDPTNEEPVLWDCEACGKKIADGDEGECPECEVVMCEACLGDHDCDDFMERQQAIIAAALEEV